MSPRDLRAALADAEGNLRTLATQWRGLSASPDDWDDEAPAELLAAEELILDIADAVEGFALLARRCHPAASQR